MSIIRLKETESTNSYAKLHIANLDDRSLIVADKQTHGRGRFDRVWVDLGEGNLFLSFVLKPSDKFLDVFQNLTQYLSVCVCHVLEEYGLKPQIKWPNDVLINGKKICGILSETVTKGNSLKGIVLGIGVNLNADSDSVSEIKDKAVTALNMELGLEHVNKEEFTEKLTCRFFRFYDEFLSVGFEYIKKDYINRTSFIGSEISVRVFDDIKSGIAKSLTDRGELVLSDNNKELVLTMGDIL